MDASVKCKSLKCVYCVDWLVDMPQNTWRASEARCIPSKRYGCMRVVAWINQKPLVPCALEVEHPQQQLVMF